MLKKNSLWNAVIMQSQHLKVFVMKILPDSGHVVTDKTR